ncbi:hypothetical protein [Pelagovum pacificum]|uniref:TFIIB-type zinc ribbon-containing protein n=1 Tax=Pelagovum pacificum TaxID=2588711 RepID=A0A5C5GDS8_9RHOB|nr:hypothetical protein [Pelagovum pacificum]QQA44023.1 hypothetical protein I8N54_05455 [Pelagovum pacificum]TNY32848.1 hypothetical protein FHY64_06105 [Pelagovum pacificum]
METKIATCCYCGTRAALVLDRGRHELSCAGCGAPLHDMKRLKATPERREVHHKPVPGGHDRKEMPKKRKQKKSFKRRAVSGLFDLIEDIFD